jgi:hypothetical protein
MKAAYHKLYGRDLELDINSDTSGYFRDFFTTLLRGRDETGVYNVESDVEALYKAGPGRFFGTGIGTDVNVFLSLLNQRPTIHLRAVFARYHEVHGKTIEKLIDSEFGFAPTDYNTRRALMQTVHYIKDPIGKIVTDFEDAAKGFLGIVGTKDRKLVRLVVRHFRFEAFGGPDRTLIINEAYRMAYGQPLALRIARDTALPGEADYSNALQSIIEFGITRRNL